MRLSILDQSPVQKGGTARQALLETTALAQLGDELGYHRYWVSEHHNTSMLAGSAPEVLIAHLANHTAHMRLGSGGVMLPHYSALKVAENFRLLEALAPGRIDLGMGRAPGADRLTASVLNPGNNFSEEEFAQQLFDLQNYLNDQFEPGTIGEKVSATPKIDTVPAQWLLSSSGGSGLFAAYFGMAFAFAHFINPNGGPEAVQSYRNRFRPSVNLKTPESLVAVFVFCSEDEEKIKQQRAVTDHRFIQFEKGRFEPLAYEDVAGVIYTEEEQLRVMANRPRSIIGKPAEVKTAIETLATAYGVEEVMASTITPNFEDRLQSYRLLADLFGQKNGS